MPYRQGARKGAIERDGDVYALGKAHITFSDRRNALTTKLEGGEHGSLLAEDVRAIERMTVDAAGVEGYLNLAELEYARKLSMRSKMATPEAKAAFAEASVSEDGTVLFPSSAQAARARLFFGGGDLFGAYAVDEHPACVFLHVAIPVKTDFEPAQTVFEALGVDDR